MIIRGSFFWQMKEILDPPFHRNQSQESQHNQPSKKGRIEHAVNNNQHQHKVNNEPNYQNQEPQNEIIEIEDLPYSSPKLIPKSQSPTHSSTEISSFQNLAIVTYSPTHNTPLQKSNEKDEGQQAPAETPQEILDVQQLNQALAPPPLARQSVRLKGKKPV
jgi:hypothetical protein